MARWSELLGITGVVAALYVAAAGIRAASAPGLWVDALWGALPFALTLFFLAWVGTRARRGFLLTAWPVLLWPLLYDGAVTIVSLAPERYVDSWLAWMDARLIGGVPGQPPTALGGPAEELANVFYVSYYLVVPLGYVWAWSRRGVEAASRYAHALLVAFSACALVWLALPSGGYHPTGSPITEAVGPFTELARAVYANNPHYAAAFPSSHVALAFTVAAALVQLGASRWWLVWALGVTWSTVQGQYHYLVDAPPGVLIGVAAVAWAFREQIALEPVLRRMRAMPLPFRVEPPGADKPR